MYFISSPYKATGDMNSSGDITKNDVYYILMRASGLDKIQSDETLKIADLDGDGRVTMNDAYLASKKIDVEKGVVRDLGANTVTRIKINENEISTSKAPISSSDSDSSKSILISQNALLNQVDEQRVYIYPDLDDIMKLRDQFIIVSFGYGHGLGMSQYGAEGYAALGYNYIQILQHYYTGVAVMQETPPQSVKIGSQTSPAYQAVARIVQSEIAGICKYGKDIEALKAQAVAAYTNLKRDNYRVSGTTYSSSYDSCRSDVKQAVNEVIGQYMTYNGETIYAYYTSCTAGVTGSYKNVWGYGTEDIPYLQSVTSYTDINTYRFVRATSYSPEALKRYLISYDPTIELSDSPSEWISILSHDDAVNNNIGYVISMKIGSRVINGNAGWKFRESVMDYDVSSPCFCIIYNGQYL